MLFFGKDWVLCDNTSLNSGIKREKSKELYSPLLDIRIPVFRAKMADHLNLLTQRLKLDCKLGHGAQHHSLRLVAGCSEMFVDSLEDTSWIFSCLDQSISKL